MKQYYRHYTTLLTAVAIGLCIGLPAQAEPPPWAPAHGKRAKQMQEPEYRYVYYPAQQVYYSPEQQIWFWMNGGNWQFGVNLPLQYRVQTATGISVTLDASRPYVQHAYVEEQYGRPWREQHQGKDKHKEKQQKNRGHD